MDTRRRSMVKSLSWRIIAVSITSSIAWAVTGSFSFAAEIGVLDSILKIGVMYGHERAWARISFGKERELPPPEYQI